MAKEKPKTAAELNREGINLLAAGKFQEAIEAFSKAIEVDANYSAAYLNRAEAYRRAGNESQAIEDEERYRSLIEQTKPEEPKPAPEAPKEEKEAPKPSRAKAPEPPAEEPPPREEEQRPPITAPSTATVEYRSFSFGGRIGGFAFEGWTFSDLLTHWTIERFFRVLLLAAGFAALGVLVAKVSFCPEITGGEIISKGCGGEMLALTLGGAGFGALVGAIIPWGLHR
ncbi:MAG: tetratricopeptide repeat protein [Dehalococcoidia bacterium]